MKTSLITHPRQLRKSIAASKTQVKRDISASAFNALTGQDFNREEYELACTNAEVAKNPEQAWLNRVVGVTIPMDNGSTIEFKRDRYEKALKGAITGAFKDWVTQQDNRARHTVFEGGRGGGKTKALKEELTKHNIQSYVGVDPSSGADHSVPNVIVDVPDGNTIIDVAGRKVRAGDLQKLVDDGFVTVAWDGEMRWTGKVESTPATPYDVKEVKVPESRQHRVGDFEPHENVIEPSATHLTRSGLRKSYAKAMAMSRITAAADEFKKARDPEQRKKWCDKLTTTITEERISGAISIDDAVALRVKYNIEDNHRKVESEKTLAYRLLTVENPNEARKMIIHALKAGSISPREALKLRNQFVAKD